MATDLSADFKRINRMSIADKKQCSGLHLGLFFCKNGNTYFIAIFHRGIIAIMPRPMNRNNVVVSEYRYVLRK